MFWHYAVVDGSLEESKLGRTDREGGYYTGWAKMAGELRAQRKTEDSEERFSRRTERQQVNAHTEKGHRKMLVVLKDGRKFS